MSGIPMPNAQDEFTEVFPLRVISEESSTPNERPQEIVTVPDADPVQTSLQKTETPLRLRIARIGVDAPIQDVGLAADGSMDVPTDPFETGWYELGPRPGEIGSAVIAGHVDSPTSAYAVFTDLEHLVIGDIITIETSEGILSFRVREMRVYPANADATDIFMSTDGKAHLNLITCSGSWDTNTKQYTDRLVIFTDKD